MGAGRRPARHVKTALTARTDTGGSGGGLLGSPGSMVGGMAPTVTTHGPQAADGPPAILEPERPRRRRSNRNLRPPPGSRRRIRCAFPHAARCSPRGPAGCRPATHRDGLSSSGGPRAFRSPRQPPGVLRGRSRSVSGATEARPGGGACGPFRAALIDVQKVLPHRLAAGRPASGLRGHDGLTCRYPVLLWRSSSTPARPSAGSLDSPSEMPSSLLPLMRATSRRFSIAPVIAPVL